MHEYSHIDSIWKRDMSRKGVIIPGDYAAPEFEYLAECEWVGTEKVDGTNIRVMWDGQSVRFGGKTDAAQTPPFLLSKLQDIFDGEVLGDQFGYDRELVPGSSSIQVCLYGEGYGARIQKGGGNYNPSGVDFVLFDVKVAEWWLKREALEDIATRLGIGIVPIVFQGSLSQACSQVSAGMKSTWGDFQSEGLVLKPGVDLLKRNGDRVIAKIKTKDYVDLQRHL